jgi:hypothetical protein
MIDGGAGKITRSGYKTGMKPRQDIPLPDGTMKMMARILIGLLLVGGMMPAAENAPPDYRSQILTWQQHREAGLRSEDGWLTLAGLFWLKPGNNSIGSGDTNDFLLPNDAPPQVGVLKLSGKVVTFSNLAGDRVTVNKKALTGPVALHYDADDNSDIVQVGPISFYVIERGDKLGIRVKDRNSQTLQTFKGTQFFPINAAFRFEAKFIPDPRKIAVPSVIGQTEMQESPGIVEFSYKGQTYRLRPVYEGKTLFFIFKDLTSKKETYPAGRMLNTPLPQGNKVILDFNKAYNPPCCFTPYATCPLPPRDNSLPIRIEAGELRFESANKL